MASCVQFSVLSDSLIPYGLYPAHLLCSCNLSNEEYWSRLPFPTPEDLQDPEIESMSPACPALAGRFTTVFPWKAPGDYTK